MGLEFDAAAAMRLEAECGSAVTVLGARSRSETSDSVFLTFSGPYADQYRVILGVEQRDRCVLVGCLRDLREQVARARFLAEREEERLAAVAKQQTQEKQADERQTDPLAGIARLADTMPTPVPVLSAHFAASRRQRLASGSSRSSMVSASPEVLRECACAFQGVDGRISDAFVALERAWQEFQASCGWVDTSDVSVLRPSGLSQYLQENKLDATWLTSIADAFDQAGGCQALPVLNVTAAVVKGNHDLITEALGDPLLSDDEVVQLVGLLARDDSLAASVANYVLGQLRAIKDTSSLEDVERAQRLLEAVSASERACGELTVRLGGDGIVNLISIAGIQSQTLGTEPTQRFAASLRDVFGKGVTWLDQNRPVVVESIADQVVSRLRNPDRTLSCEGGNDAYAVSFLLGSELAWPPNFLLSLGDGLEDLEHSMPRQSGYPWSDRKMMSIGIGSFFTAEQLGGAYDPMTAYMNALAKSPQASLAFFTGEGVPGYALAESELRARQEYWLEKRAWSQDGFTSILAALDSAVADTTTAGSQAAAKLTSSLVFYFANRAQGQDITGNPITPLSDQEKFLPGHLSKPATLHLAHILTTHMAAVDYNLTEHEQVRNGSQIDSLLPLESPRFPTFNEDNPSYQGASFYRGDIKMMLKVVLSDEDGVLAMRKGVTLYHELEFDNIAKIRTENPAGYEEAMGQAVRSHAALNGEFVKQIGDIAIEGARAKDAWICAGIELTRHISEGVVVVGSTTLLAEAAPVPEVLADVTFDGLEQETKKAFANNAEHAIQDRNQAAELALQESQIEALNLSRKAGLLSNDMVMRTAGKDIKSYRKAIAWLDSLDDPHVAQHTQIDVVIDRTAKRDLPGFKDYQGEYRNAFFTYHN